MELFKETHKKYFLRYLNVLPQQATEHDSSRTALAYFCISGLAVLGALDDVINDSNKRTQWADWLYSNLVTSGEGFRGSSTHKLPGANAAEYDCANIPATYFSIMSLATLRDERMATTLDRTKIAEYVGRCQRQDGSFAPNWAPAVGPFGENDPRCNYMAAGILTALETPPATVKVIVSIDQAVKYVLSTLNYDGGLAQQPGNESHAGLTFCGLASLSLFLAFDDRVLDSVNDWTKTVRWLARRQIVEPDPRWDDEVDEMLGGFNGRTGKPADTCYAFWVSASLEILKTGLSQQLLDGAAADNFILGYAQARYLGGLAKIKGVPPDPLHSYLGLAAISIMDTEARKSNGLPRIVPALSITEETHAWLKTCW